MTATRPHTRRAQGPVTVRRLAAGVALVVAGGVALVLLLKGGAPPSTDAGSHAARLSGATTVRRRNLVQTDTESGTLSHAHPQTVYDRLSGTITWLPRVGATIRPGQPLFKVDGRPVILMRGTTPAFRELDASDGEGADIEQLNRNLVRLGFNADAIVVDDAWQPATSLGVELMQESLSEPETGVLPLGDIVFLPGDQLVASVDATVGSTGGGASPGATSATDASGPGPATTAAPEFVDLQTSSTTTTTPPTPTTRRPPRTRPRRRGRGP